jgi:hypothetical protein
MIRLGKLARGWASIRRQYSQDASTANRSELAHFSRLSSAWWDEQGEFKPLHQMNPTRVKFIRDKIIQTRQMTDIDSSPVSISSPLSGLKVLDVGCGGGLLCEVGRFEIHVRMARGVTFQLLVPCPLRRRNARNRRCRKQYPGCIFTRFTVHKTIARAAQIRAYHG